MKKTVLKGILIDKAKFKDNSLIIKLLATDGQLLSGLFFVRKDSCALNYLFSYEVSVIQESKTRFAEFRLIDMLPVNTACYDQYFLVAEILRQLGDSAQGLDYYLFLEEQRAYFFNDYSPSFHIEFLIHLIYLFGYIPEPSSEHAFFDLRSGLFTNEVPSHSDYCLSEKINPAFVFSLGNTDLLRISNVTERTEIFFILIRFLEIRKGMKFALKSIDVLREIR